MFEGSSLLLSQNLKAQTNHKGGKEAVEEREPGGTPL